MIVHFSASTQQLKDDLPTFKQIIKLVEDSGHTIDHNWTQHDQVLNKAGLHPSDQNWPKFYRQKIDRIGAADVLIIEASRNNFSTGYTAALALQLKKPILILYNNDDYYGMVTGLPKDFATVTSYTRETLPDIILEFLEKHDIKQKDLRFNFFIDREIHNYLAWASSKTGENKSAIIRKLIKDKIKENQERNES